MFINVHQFRRFPFNCINRGEFNEIKTTKFGGTIRARISSQCIKKAIRDYLKTLNYDIAVRTRLPHCWSETPNIQKAVAICLANTNKKPKDKNGAAEEIIRLLDSSQLNLDGDKIKTQDEDKEVLEVYSPNEYEAIKQMIVDAIGSDSLPALVKDGDICKKIKNLKLSMTIDMALFGRFSAQLKLPKIEGAVQMAHSFTTSEFEQNDHYDYLTAEDMINKGGAGHIGSQRESASGLYFMSASINVDLLRDNLKDSPTNVIKDFIKAFTIVTPAGKATSEASNEPAVYILISISDIPLTSATPFARDIDMEQEAIEVIENYYLYGAPKMLVGVQPSDLISMTMLISKVSPLKDIQDLSQWIDSKIK